MAAFKKYCKRYRLINARSLGENGDLELSYYVTLKSQAQSTKFIHDLKQVVGEILQNEDVSKDIQKSNAQLIEKMYRNIEAADDDVKDINLHKDLDDQLYEPIQESEVVEESLSIQDKEIDLIRRALAKHNGKRKNAAKELGISERTLYRKIKEYGL